MRIRTNIIVSEELLAKIDVIAGEKQKRAATIEQALREFVEREEAKAPINLEVETADAKVSS
jgi:metal-responsive CopG/Arc/MetJ family transcriptional regulator